MTPRRRRARAWRFGRRAAPEADSAPTGRESLADQLVLFCGLAHGNSSYIVPRTSAHLNSNLWLIAQFGAQVATDTRRVQIHGIGLTR